MINESKLTKKIKDNESNLLPLQKKSMKKFAMQIPPIELRSKFLSLCQIPCYIAIEDNQAQSGEWPIESNEAHAHLPWHNWPPSK